MTHIRVFLLEGDEASNNLLRRLKSLPSCRVEAYACPPSMEELQPVPFMQVDDQERFFGIDGIDAFIEQHAV